MADVQSNMALKNNFQMVKSKVTDMQVYTIGYGGRQPQDFLDLLQHYQVERIVDVRLRPDRASMGKYAKAKRPDKGIEGLLAERDIAYVSLTELGNVFMGCEDWSERYQRLMKRAGDLLIERLLEIRAPYCLMCAERQATACHRQVIAAYLAEHGFEIEHLE